MLKALFHSVPIKPDGGIYREALGYSRTMLDGRLVATRRLLSFGLFSSLLNTEFLHW